MQGRRIALHTLMYGAQYAEAPFDIVRLPRCWSHNRLSLCLVESVLHKQYTSLFGRSQASLFHAPWLPMSVGPQSSPIDRLLNAAAISKEF